MECPLFRQEEGGGGGRKVGSAWRYQTRTHLELNGRDVTTKPHSDGRDYWGRMYYTPVAFHHISVDRHYASGALIGCRWLCVTRNDTQALEKGTVAVLLMALLTRRCPAECVLSLCCLPNGSSP